MLPVYRKIRWHAFSYGFSAHQSGADALSSYLAHRLPGKLYLLDEMGREGYQFSSSCPIDFSTCARDIYIFPETMEWTMVFTHEQPHFGPYYARATGLVTSPKAARVRRTP